MDNGGVMQRENVVELDPKFLFRWEEPQQAYILLYPEGLVKLNATAGEILAEVANTAEIGAIVDHFATKYQNLDIANDILAFLEEAHERGWIRITR
ncbi:pyrroloquinoline quinone biosynthesis peptide chaperone PqqD [Acidiphilium sp.]|jgi:pyrroloquinoline quinone biosynthesis protein D|uniref:pyrroloquinoline quinone biosynthesis peptide chaperone PqqD n=1 Tax=Acidiphilium sp. TaxID=527 RepID=UPI0025912404|nr:pyrroloquinoline quinone biosynthesis peptide chaperone PqqD [Acidiphilium sp.]